MQLPAISRAQIDACTIGEEEKYENDTFNYSTQLHILPRAHNFTHQGASTISHIIKRAQLPTMSGAQIHARKPVETQEYEIEKYV